MKPTTVPMPLINIMVFPREEVAVQGMAHSQKAVGEEYLLRLPPHAPPPGLLGQEQGCHQNRAPKQDQLLLQPGLSPTWI
jgi:hypothetical protein